MLNLVITIGGDGTILWGNHLFTGYEKPYFITFNLGTLGYLSYYNCQDYKKIINHLFLMSYIDYESRSTLDILFKSKNKELNDLQLNALNDIVLEKGSGVKMIKTKIGFIIQR